jgi:hypothetical protein
LKIKYNKYYYLSTCGNAEVKDLVMMRAKPMYRLHVRTISAKVTLWPTRYVLEDKWVLRASSDLLKKLIAASSIYTKITKHKKKR